MLVCPQCQYDNPNHSQSCHQCGVSLSERSCPECGSMIAVEDTKCPNCQAFTATVWWAVVEQITQSKKEGKLNDSGLIHASTLPNHSSIESNLKTKTIQTQYLDPGQRYRVMIEPDPANFNLNLPPETFNQRLRFEGRILDCQPLQKSVIKTFLERQEEWLDYDHPPDKTNQPFAVLWRKMGIPELAFPYLRLLKFSPLIPELHDAWCATSRVPHSDGKQEVILLSDRSRWQLMSDLWATEEFPTLQIVYWLDKMASLWIPLSKVHCCQSLLIENNLRVDEDQTFGLLRLYNDPPDSQPTLQDLGRMWQQLLHHSKQPKIDALEQVLEQMISQEINTITQLCLQLHNLGSQQEVEVIQFLSDSSDDDDLDTMPLPRELYDDENQLDTEFEDETIIEGNIGEDLSTADLPMQLLSLTDAAYTDVGRLRRHNEDHFGLETYIKKQQTNRGQTIQARGLYIVCDGMGGHASGEVASAMAVDTLKRYFWTHCQNGLPDLKTIEQGILLTNNAIYQVNRNKDSHGCGRMGTTLVMVLLDGTRIAIAHVGDSRVYQINRKWGLEQLTVDHEVGQRAISQGVDPKIAYSRPDAYQLTQALGPHDNNNVQPDIKYLDLHEDTLLLLCSDGLSDNKFLETHYSTCLTPLISSNANLEDGLRQLIALANQKNGHDNLSAIIIRIKLQPCFE